MDLPPRQALRLEAQRLFANDSRAQKTPRLRGRAGRVGRWWRGSDILRPVEALPVGEAGGARGGGGLRAAVQ